jgi:DNA-binding NarL/FixJ family response regulator
MAESPAPRHRILVIDDHPIVRQGIASLLAQEPDMVLCGEAGTYDDALSRAAATSPDVALVDITLKDRSGLDLIREFRERFPSIKNLVLSMHDEEEYAERALKAGARGYVMKEKADEVVVDAIRLVMQGELYISPEISSRMLKQYLAGDAAPAETGVDSLTDREREIFRLMGRGLSTKRIAEELALSARTVEVHRAHIKRKMQCEDLAQLLREAIRFAESNH